MRNSVKDSLSDNFNVFKAPKGDSLINIVFPRIVDLAITDITMPGTVRPLQKTETDNRTFRTSGASPKNRTTIEARIEGLVTFHGGFLNKPPDINELKLRITNLLLERQKPIPEQGLTEINSEKELSCDSMDEVFMKKIDRIINDNIKSLDFDVGMLQDKMGISRVQLYRKIKALSGVSPSTMIHRHRMQRAARLIQGKAGNLAEISLSVGYTNPSYFSKRFREYYGSSPRAYSNKPV